MSGRAPTVILDIAIIARLNMHSDTLNSQVIINEKIINILGVEE